MVRLGRSISKARLEREGVGRSWGPEDCGLRALPAGRYYALASLLSLWIVCAADRRSSVGCCSTRCVGAGPNSLRLCQSALFTAPMITTYSFEKR